MTKNSVNICTLEGSSFIHQCSIILHMELIFYDAKAAEADIKSAIRKWHQLEEILLYRFVFNVKSRFVDPDPH
jgi:hypothetical protein